METDRRWEEVRPKTERSQAGDGKETEKMNDGIGRKAGY